MLDQRIMAYAENFGGYPIGYEKLDSIFMENRALFRVAAPATIEGWRNMESDYGVLPMPKYDEAQREYYCANSVNGVFGQGVPVTNDKLEMTGAFLEALAYESQKTVVPVYYETSLKIKLLRDEESIEMLDLMSRSRVFDLVYIYNWGNTGEIYSNLMIKKSRDFASEYAKKENSIIAAMEKSLSEILE